MKEARLQVRQPGVNTPAFAPQDIDQSAMRTESERCNSQLWRIQEDDAEIQKTQVELLGRRMTVPVSKPSVFEGNIFEYPKWEIASFQSATLLIVFVC